MMHRNRQISLYILALFFCIATTAQVSELKISEIPDFEKVTETDKNQQFWGKAFTPPKAVRIYAENHFRKLPLQTQYFYQKSSDSTLVKLLPDTVSMHSMKLGIQLPCEGLYWVKIWNEEGCLYFLQFASKNKGWAKEIFVE